MERRCSCRRLVPADQNASKAVHPAVSAFHHAPGLTGIVEAMWAMKRAMSSRQAQRPPGREPGETVQPCRRGLAPSSVETALNAMIGQHGAIWLWLRRCSANSSPNPSVVVFQISIAARTPRRRPIQSADGPWRCRWQPSTLEDTVETAAWDSKVGPASDTWKEPVDIP